MDERLATRAAEERVEPDDLFSSIVESRQRLEAAWPILVQRLKRLRESAMAYFRPALHLRDPRTKRALFVVSEVREHNGVLFFGIDSYRGLSVECKVGADFGFMLNAYDEEGKVNSHAFDASFSGINEVDGGGLLLGRLDRDGNVVKASTPEEAFAEFVRLLYKREEYLMRRYVGAF